MDWSVTQGFEFFSSLCQVRHRARAFYGPQGKLDPAAKPLRGFGGASILEIVASHDGNAWRAVCTVRFQDAVYVLHVFQKKSTRGIATPKREIDLIKQRLAEAERTIEKEN